MEKRERRGGRSVIKMRAEEKAHVKNKSKCVLTKGSGLCVERMHACLCLLPAVCCVFAGDMR